MLPFDAEVLASSYTEYNAAIWPAQAVALLLALAALWLAAAPRSWNGRAIGGLLVCAWLWCGVVYFFQHFARYDFLAPVYGWAFLAEAALLVWGLLWRAPRIAVRPSAAGLAGFALALAAVLLLPLISGLGEAGFASARLAGVAPGPTAALTLGLLVLMEGRRRWLLMILPLAWCAVAGIQAWALNLPEAWPLPVLGAVAVLAAALRN